MNRKCMILFTTWPKIQVNKLLILDSPPQLLFKRKLLIDC